MPKQSAPARKASASAKKASPSKGAPKGKPPAKKPPAKPELKSKAPAKAPPPPPKGKQPAKAPPPKAADSKASPAADPKKVVRKGITIVAPKPTKKASVKAAAIKMPHLGSPLIKPGSVRKPLISSGPNAPRPKNLFAGEGKPKKSPFDKRELAKFKAILLRKRAELVGDVSTMETEALMGQSGSLSNVPQHLAEQGSDTYGQSLSLDLAAADRRLIKEIDDALKRIDVGTYGVCELTGKPIRAERLEELPWARYSIEAARELERRSTSPVP